MSLIPIQRHAYVGIGSNLGDRARYLVLSIKGMLDAGISITRLSSIYETEPVGLLDQPPFLNMVAELGITTGNSAPEKLLASLLEIEFALGRRRQTPGGPRLIDLDLLLFAQERRETEFLTLPHPRLHERRFALAPLAEIRPELVHPVLGCTISELLSQVNDQGMVQRWRPGLTAM